MNAPIRFLFVVSFAFCWLSEPAYAEFGVSSMAKFALRSEMASAQFNEALSEFHLFLAGIDGRKSSVQLSDRKAETVNKLRISADAYEKCNQDANDRILKLNPNSNDEKMRFEFLDNYWREHKKAPVYTEKTILAAIVIEINDFANKLEKMNPSELAKNLKMQQSLAEESVKLQALLLATTTALNVG